SRQSQSSANSFVGELTRIIESGLEKSGSVTISGFGKFELRWMSERPGVNPRTGEEITIPGQNRVVFKPYKALREEVNRPYSRLKAQVLGGKPGSKASEDEHDEIRERPKPVTGPIRLGPDPSEKEEENELVLERDRPKNEEGQKEKSAALQTQDDELFDPFKEDQPLPPPVEEVNGSGSMTWTYGAVAIVLLLAILFILFMMQRQADIADDLGLTADAPQPPAETEQPVIAPTDPDPEPEPEVDEPFTTTVVQMEAGQTLWSLADAELGDPFLWPVIYSLNSSLIDDPNMVFAGSDLIIPEFADPDNLTETELTEVARGYLMLYEWSRENNPEEARNFLWAVGVFSMDLLESAEETADPSDWEFANRR
ncbi:MAG: HU family DNA-binding protein, partial [Balneolaceae bacterium]|nr:HU family DNA-binding protein [Balneolaceae bacterium]